MPNPGTFYTVIAGDTLRTISRRTYGIDKADDIADANNSLLANRVESLEGEPTVYAGDRIWLPNKSTSKLTTISALVDDEITIQLGGKLFKGWTASSATRSLNKVADGFTFTLPYDYTDDTLRELTAPYSYKDCDLFIGNELYISGQSIKWQTSVNGGKTSKTIDARTKAGNLIECMGQKKSTEYTNRTLSDIAVEILKSWGEDLYPEFWSGDSDIFTKVSKEITETDFSFLMSLASQKGFLLTSSDDGGIAFTRAELDGLPVFRIIEGITAVEHISTSADGTKRFSSMQAITETAGTSGTNSSLSDDTVNIYRPLVFEADDLEAGNLTTALEWRRSKALADSYSVSITVTGWRNENGDLWRENMKGTVLYPSVDISTESDYIISSVSLTKDENGGNISTLQMVIPQAYSLEFPTVFPWED